jgi:hypothetical protein
MVPGPAGPDREPGIPRGYTSPLGTPGAWDGIAEWLRRSTSDAGAEPDNCYARLPLAHIARQHLAGG